MRLMQSCNLDRKAGRASTAARLNIPSSGAAVSCGWVVAICTGRLPTRLGHAPSPVVQADMRTTHGLLGCQAAQGGRKAENSGIQQPCGYPSIPAVQVSARSQPQATANIRGIQPGPGIPLAGCELPQLGSASFSPAQVPAPSEAPRPGSLLVVVARSTAGGGGGRCCSEGLGGC